MVSLSTLYNNIMTLIGQNYYDKDTVEDYIGDINDFIDSNYDNVLTSEVTDSVTDNDLRPVSSNAVYDALQGIGGDVDIESALEELIDEAIEEEENL